MQQLLGAMLEESAASAGAESTQNRWELPVLPPPDPEGRLSSTDLLSWWFGTPMNRSDVAEVAPPRAAADLSATLERAVDGRPPAEQLSDVLAVFPEPEELLADEHAQAAVDCLYEFLHAVGRRDVDGAMAQIENDYHSIEDAEEVDKLKFRYNLEAHLESLRDHDFSVSLAEAPEPVSHPYGVLISARFQFDACHRTTGEKTGSFEHRVAVLQPDGAGNWKIRSLARIS
jgi:hypothetical protein